MLTYVIEKLKKFLSFTVGCQSMWLFHSATYTFCQDIHCHLTFPIFYKLYIIFRLLATFSFIFSFWAVFCTIAWCKISLLSPRLRDSCFRAISRCRSNYLITITLGWGATGFSRCLLRVYFCVANTALTVFLIKTIKSEECVSNRSIAADCSEKDHE